MTKFIILFVALFSGVAGCRSSESSGGAIDVGRGLAQEPDTPGQEVTVLIALSSLVPGGIVGHAGIAVEDEYWDFGPTRSKYMKPIKSVYSDAGPWWDDPEQAWAADRRLDEVVADLPEKVHPMGALVAVVRVRVTDEQAEGITRFWHDTYERMHQGEDKYCLTARQCASMVGWSLRVGMEGSEAAGDRLPRDLCGMSPTQLYEALSDSLVHTAGPRKGEPADVTLWQLDEDGFSPWERPAAYDRLSLPELMRVRLAYERIKHLPVDVLY